MKLTAREMTVEETESMVDYFIQSDPEFLGKMGADYSKLPSREDWLQKLFVDFKKPYAEKEFYYISWLENDRIIGYSNVNHIKFGSSAKMHLHLWEQHQRNKGLGIAFLKLSIPFYFNHLNINTLICEPYSKNQAPNKTLKKLGFAFDKAYETIPGSINFRQLVNRYELTRSVYKTLDWAS